MRRLSLVLICAIASRAAADDLDDRLAVRAERIAAHEYAAGEYYRAIGGYEEVSLLSADNDARTRAAIRIAMSYHHGHQLADAIDAYDRALALPLPVEQATALRIQLALAKAERVYEEPGSEAFDAITAELEPSSLPSAGSPEIRGRALFELVRIDLLAGRRDRALHAAAELTYACGPAACGLAAPLAAALRVPRPPHRAPWLGVVLSAVVPGAGSVYGGRTIDGIYYFALTTASGLGALDVYEPHHSFGDQHAAFYGLAALAAVFYAGNVLQGYVSVHRYNDVSALDARRAVWSQTGAPWPLELSSAPPSGGAEAGASQDATAPPAQ
ncbi:MAG TPA: hypothetical protein VGM88_20275 [Kofleriaceae bacterium]|jgi:tetratricopeptide (TPR) repeat protein